MTVEASAFWTMIGTWFTGLATFGAVVVSLYLGSKIHEYNSRLV